MDANSCCLLTQFGTVCQTTWAALIAILPLAVRDTTAWSINRKMIEKGKLETWRVKYIKIPSVLLSANYLLIKLTISLFAPFRFSQRALMEIQPPPIMHPPSPSNSAAVMSSESLSHHSSPAKTSRVHYHHHHQVTTIDERMPTSSVSKVPLSVSSHHQLVAALSSPVSISGPQPSISGVSALQLQVQQRQNMMTQTTHTGHLALLYHSSQHHHHHLHPPALPPVRRPSRLPPTIVITRPPEIKA